MTGLTTRPTSNDQPEWPGAVAGGPPFVRPARVAIVGIHGHGSSHVRNAIALQEDGRCHLVAVADPRPPEPGTVGPDVLVFADLDALLAALEVDIVVVCTPIHTHRQLAEAAMRAGADVLLEKPPVPTMAEFTRLLALCAETDRSCQIGFQSLGSQAVPALAAAVAAGGLGAVPLISTRCAWIRSVDYFSRTRWAGHRELDGIPVMDGVLSNPFAHAVATALRVDGSTRIEDVLTVETDLFRANNISSDDTSTVRVTTRRGTTLLFAATLCSPVVGTPMVIVRGTSATATLQYTTDQIDVIGTAGEPVPSDLTGSYGRDNLLANLIEHRANSVVPLIADVRETGAFTAVLEALRLAPAPAVIPESCFEWREDDYGRHAVVGDVVDWIRLAAERGQTFTELGAPWTEGAKTRRADDTFPSSNDTKERLGFALRIGETAVATYDPGFDTIPTSSPRPFLHPVRTLGGFVVTDAYPADHDWHVGIGVAVQGVNGWNLWGGRTYVRDAGYQWLGDHGRIEHVRWNERGTGRAVEELAWVDSAGGELLRERRELRWGRAAGESPQNAGAWVLELSFTLSVPPAAEFDFVKLGSPGSNGREAGGYGGFFWRLPRTDAVTVRTPDAIGEADVHGTVADWLAVSLETGGDAATIVVLPTDPVTGSDRWFVRCSGYPGIGSSLAWDQPVEVARSRPVRRGFRAVIADGRPDPADLIARGWGTTRGNGSQR
jgi:predicted dehydrogenase